MVKEVADFLRWQAKRLEWDDYTWAVGCFLIGAGINDNKSMLLAGAFVLFGTIIASLIRMQWRRWKSERKELLETIRDSK